VTANLKPYAVSHNIACVVYQNFSHGSQVLHTYTCAYGHFFIELTFLYKIKELVKERHPVSEVSQ
jgi:hypothetical protein